MSFMRKWFGPSPQEIIHRAVARAALLKGESSESDTRARYYAVLLRQVDPHKDWWRFAELKQCHVNAVEDAVFDAERAEKAQQDVDALIAEYARRLA
jgi:hypothetical protein